MRNLFKEYLDGNADALGFFAHGPRVLDGLVVNARQWDAELVGEIRAYQERVGGSAGFSGNEAVVVTGQQAGIFTGPLYTVYKAVTAIKLAARYREETGIPCVPLFWVASDDHDFEEVRTGSFLTKSHEPLTLRYSPVADVDGMPAFNIPLEDSIHDLINEAGHACQGSELSGEILEFLHESAHAADSLADWTARLLARLFADTPLLLFAPHLSRARELAAKVMEREIANPLAVTRLVDEAGARLEAHGYARQITRGVTDCNFFLEVDRRRRKVVFEKGRYRLPEENLDYSIEEMLSILAESPGRFSANVALRPIVQQVLFPAAAYVGGPAEVAYWAQLRPVFEFFGLPMPVVYPRARCTLTTVKTSKLMNRLGLSLGDFDRSPDELTKLALRTANRNKAYEVVIEQGERIVESIGALAERLTKTDPVARDMADAMRRHTEHELGRIADGILTRDAEKVATVRGQVERLCNTLAPWRKSQERVYTIFTFMFQQGWRLVPRLIRELDIDSFEVNEEEL